MFFQCFLCLLSFLFVHIQSVKQTRPAYLAVCVLYKPHFLLESRFREMSWLSWVFIFVSASNPYLFRFFQFLPFLQTKPGLVSSAFSTFFCIFPRFSTFSTFFHVFPRFLHFSTFFLVFPRFSTFFCVFQRFSSTFFHNFPRFSAFF